MSDARRTAAGSRVAVAVDALASSVAGRRPGVRRASRSPLSAGVSPRTSTRPVPLPVMPSLTAAA
ncbi:hypothetical protein NB709_002350 [Xanthomonas sacchari]|uniref:Uncharacterized protein n=1 Tax=Xanthomonas sacchari TaxID=56458 RepID=A0ABT3E2F6_9XANT|nr:hypothetical protein [Xanthomonas sacchari]MCW0412474.1 hypothetical protein [Xanthomonas sacchari]